MDNVLSPSSEDYLEAIFDLSVEGESVRSVDVANRLDVSRASVNKAVGLLRDAGLIEQEPYGTITLTEKGATAAATVRRRHNMLYTFLNKILSIPDEVAEQEACKIEHIISDLTFEHLSDFVDKTLDSMGVTE